MDTTTAQMASLTVSVDIQASADDVWTALTSDIGKWWPADFYAGGEDGHRTFILEQQPGGRMYEQWPDGGVLWGHVVTLNPGRQLQVLGCVFPSFGGPNEWYGTWDLEETSPGTTRLTFSEDSIGKVSQSSVGEKETGWRFLSDCLKAFIEGQPQPVWEST